MYQQHPLSAAIYQIRNTSNGRVYVGSAVRLAKRWKEHLRDLRAGRHHSQKLQNAWNKYGEESFEFSILEAVFDKSKLLDQEQYWIDLLCAANRVNYNISISAASPMLGRSPSTETRARLALAMTGNKHGIGHRWTDEQRAQMSLSRTGQKRTPEQRARMSAAQKGNTNKRGWSAPDETRAKLSMSMMGNTNGRKAGGAV